MIRAAMKRERMNFVTVLRALELPGYSYLATRRRREAYVFAQYFFFIGWFKPSKCRVRWSTPSGIFGVGARVDPCSGGWLLCL